MKSYSFRRRVVQISQFLDRALYRFSTLVVPAVIGVASLVILYAGQSQYPLADPVTLPIHILKEEAPITEAAQAKKLLHDQPGQRFFDTRLSEAPFWFMFTVPPDASNSLKSIEFPSRHAYEIACFDGKTFKELGNTNHTASNGDMLAIKAGFALDYNPAAKDNKVICRVSSVGPARISALLWPRADLQTSAQEFHRKSGLLDGGILILAAFVMITALINRSGLYMLFAAWLVVNLRMGALSAGWDAQWLGNAVPHEWLLRLRLVTTAIYYVLSLTLFNMLFRDDLLRIRAVWLLRVVQWSCLPLLLFAAFMPYQVYLPVLWVMTGLFIGLMVFTLTRILFKIRSPAALWYGASISITLLASLYEVLAAALGVKGLIGSVNSVTAALSSSLLASLAIAAQMRQEHNERLQAQAELQHTFDAIPIGLFTLDLNGRFLSANPALQRMLGHKVLENGSNSWQRYFSGGAWTQLHQFVNAHSDGELELRGRAKLLGGQDVNRYLVKATLARDRIEGSLQNVTEKSKAAEDLLFLANNDPLTKVLNRRGIEKALELAFKELGAGKPLALAYLDLDRFRLINDLYGHSAGDEVLQQVCQRVMHVVSSTMQFGRVGGDEFVLVMPDTKVPMASLVCRGIIESLGGSAYHVGDRAFHLRGSIGLIEVGTNMQVKDAISSADRACHDAKAHNGGGLVVYEKNAPAFDRHEAELKLVEQLSTSSATEGLFLVMQPIMSLTEPFESLNFEVLLRMNDENGKLIPTDRLISAGETSGRMSTIDRWVLQTTLDWLNQNYAYLKHTKFVCINLSGASLNDEKFLQDVFGMLEKNIHIVKHICLEVTESVALHDLDNTRRFVDKVRSYGAKVALDDFGAGYTSFSYLKELTADLLKIDGSFIVKMNRHPANIAIVEAIVNLARNLGMKTIAEWAEDAATVQTLIEVGVDYVQGFVVARPQMPDKLLTAPSSGSFVEDEELKHLLEMLGQPNDEIGKVELFEPKTGKSLH